jgi:pimeloyl-ACP methyl ester carboxylesterase
MEPVRDSFTHDGHHLAYEVVGEGEKTVVLLHGLLLSRRMHRPLALALAERGYRVVSLDFLGHGDSDRPADMTRYSMQVYAANILALLDVLDLDQAVILGTSLGANATLELSVIAPERIRGMIIEMPVLDNAMLGAAVFFLPVMLAMRFAAPAVRLVNGLARRLPTGAIPAADALMDWPRDPPEPSLAILQGLFFGRIAPPKQVRRLIAPPTLVIGHPNDPVHPFSDSDELVRELPDARLVEAESILELRLRPERLTAEIAAFVDACWAPTPEERAAERRRRAAARRRRRAKETAA